MTSSTVHVVQKLKTSRVQSSRHPSWARPYTRFFWRVLKMYNASLRHDVSAVMTHVEILFRRLSLFMISCHGHGWMMISSSFMTSSFTFTESGVPAEARIRSSSLKVPWGQRTPPFVIVLGNGPYSRVFHPLQDELSTKQASPCSWRRRIDEVTRRELTLVY